jgi:hypothetical protein
MGIVDKTTHLFTCPSCGASETVRILETGSSYGSSWSAAPETTRFDVNWRLNPYGEPRPVSMTCKACGSNARDEIS